MYLRRARHGSGVSCSLSPLRYASAAASPGNEAPRWPFLLAFGTAALSLVGLRIGPREHLADLVGAAKVVQRRPELATARREDAARARRDGVAEERLQAHLLILELARHAGLEDLVKRLDEPRLRGANLQKLVKAEK